MAAVTSAATAAKNPDHLCRIKWQQLDKCATNINANESDLSVPLSVMMSAPLPTPGPPAHSGSWSWCARMEAPPNSAHDTLMISPRSWSSPNQTRQWSEGRTERASLFRAMEGREARCLGRLTGSGMGDCPFWLFYSLCSEVSSCLLIFVYNTYPTNKHIYNVWHNCQEYNACKP